MRFPLLSPCLTVPLLVLLLPLVGRGQEEADRPTPKADAVPTSEIRDRARLFRASTVEAQADRLRSAEAKSGVPVLIETVESLKGESINDAALAGAKASGRRGVYLLISSADKAISRPLVTREFADRFPEPTREAIQKTLIDSFRKREFDAGLVAACDAILQAAGGDADAPVATQERREPAASEPSDSPLIHRGRIDLSLAGAAQIIEAAQIRARAMKLKVNIAVVDDGGHLIAFARMDGARPASGYTAMTKATTAATFRQATGPLPKDGSPPDVWLNLSLQLTAAASGGKITTLYGGVPVELDGQIIGAVGVGGGTGEQDAEVARAGIEAFLEAVGSEAVPMP